MVQPDLKMLLLCHYIKLLYLLRLSKCCTFIFLYKHKSSISLQSESRNSGCIRGSVCVSASYSYPNEVILVSSHWADISGWRILSLHHQLYFLSGLLRVFSHWIKESKQLLNLEPLSVQPNWKKKVMLNLGAVCKLHWEFHGYSFQELSLMLRWISSEAAMFELSLLLASNSHLYSD